MGGLIFQMFHHRVGEPSLVVHFDFISGLPSLALCCRNVENIPFQHFQPLLRAGAWGEFGGQDSSKGCRPGDPGNREIQSSVAGVNVSILLLAHKNQQIDFLQFNGFLHL